MSARFLGKLLSLFALSILGLLMIDTFLLFNFELESAQLVRAAASKKYDSIEEPKSKINLTAKNLTIEGLDEQSYHPGKELIVHCVIENTGEEEIKNAHAVLRSHYKSIAEIESKKLQPHETVELKGSFTPEKFGLTYFACRVDPENTIEESDETDNRDVQTIYVRE